MLPGTRRLGFSIQGVSWTHSYDKSFVDVSQSQGILLTSQSFICLHTESYPILFSCKWRARTRLQRLKGVYTTCRLHKGRLSWPNSHSSSIQARLMRHFESVCSSVTSQKWENSLMRQDLHPTSFFLTDGEFLRVQPCFGLGCAGVIG